MELIGQAQKAKRRKASKKSGSSGSKQGQKEMSRNRWQKPMRSNGQMSDLVAEAESATASWIDHMHFTPFWIVYSKG